MRVAVVAVCVAFARIASADDELAEARRLEAALEYDKALDIVERAIAHGGAEPSVLAELHMFAGRLAAGLDRVLAAEDHFARALTLRPDEVLPSGTSPKISAPFYAARSHAKPLHVKVMRNERMLALAPDPDPLGLVAGITIHATDAHGQVIDMTEAKSLNIQVPEGAHVTEVVALDANGNHVWSGPAPVDPQVIKPPPPPPHLRVTDDEPGLFRRWTTWAGASAVTLAAGGVCAWRFSVAQDEWNKLRSEPNHDYSQLVAVEQRGRHWALAADITFGVAGATAIVAVIMAITREEPPVMVAPTMGGATVMGRF